MKKELLNPIKPVHIEKEIQKDFMGNLNKKGSKKLVIKKNDRMA